MRKQTGPGYSSVARMALMHCAESLGAMTVIFGRSRMTARSMML